MGARASKMVKTYFKIKNSFDKRKILKFSVYEELCNNLLKKSNKQDFSVFLEIERWSTLEIFLQFTQY